MCRLLPKPGGRQSAAYGMSGTRSVESSDERIRLHLSKSFSYGTLILSEPRVMICDGRMFKALYGGIEDSVTFASGIKISNPCLKSRGGKPSRTFASMSLQRVSGMSMSSLNQAQYLQDLSEAKSKPMSTKTVFEPSLHQTPLAFAGLFRNFIGKSNLHDEEFCAAYVRLICCPFRQSLMKSLQTGEQ